TEIGVYPTNDNITYKWYYAESPDTILGVSGAYTVTGDNAGKTICVDVTYGNKTLTWTADDVVAAAVNPPEQPDKVADPQITPAGGSYTNSIDVTITCATDGASVYYTTDGSVPTTSSTLYTNKFTLTNSAAIKAIAVKDGMTDSSVVSVAYTINKGNNNSVGSYNPGDLGGGMIGNIAPATAPATTIPAAGITPTGNPVYDNGTTAVKEENVSSEAGSATETTAAADTNAAGKSDTNTETTSTTSVNTQTTTVAGGTTAVDTTPAPQETIETMTAVDNGTPLASGPASGGNPDAANGGKTNPVTGDNMVLLFALFTLAGIGAVVIIRKKLADK
ncbi:MAG: chitobiase/beta-hexosaminidase C-terminal domain-containing protein, partial [Oscillospiraceae bacterium]|nr:chitobiase/beta-hexosaminidase C-terminal domain-containing protein [Oscillospiraceae bacterium]